MTRSTWVLVPCQRARLEMLKSALRSYAHPADRVVVIATQPDPLKQRDLDGLADHVLLHESSVPLISAWWNQGIDYIRERAVDRHEIYAPSSDVTGRPDSVSRLRDFLRREGLAMAGPDFWNEGSGVRIFRNGETRSVGTRVPGGCWMLAGESKLRLDPQFRWWYSDDDLEMQARAAGGAGVVGGTGLVPGPDTSLSEEKAVWAQEDRQRFVRKWGVEPW